MEYIFNTWSSPSFKQIQRLHFLGAYPSIPTRVLKSQNRKTGIEYQEPKNCDVLLDNKKLLHV